uniref:P2X purinoceptor n=1 Tax=Hucho hucho TaxID=62062 RepID=A0A4W5K945_9TELE
MEAGPRSNVLTSSGKPSQKSGGCCSSKGGTDSLLMWVFIYEKGYQSSDMAVGSVLTKMKGVGYTNVAGEERIWDVADYVFPVQGDSSFVVMTNYIMTKGQKIEKCSELKSYIPRVFSPCLCPTTHPPPPPQGHMTGKCLVNTTNMCEVLAWCPVEDDSNIPEYVRSLKIMCNLVEGIDNQYVKSCLYDPKTSPLCPIFRLGDLVQLSGFNFAAIAKVGGAIGIIIDWTCNLDYDQSDCKPIYSFHGLYGNPNETDMARASVGYNFRYAKHYMEDTKEKRTLLKVFGIRFDIIVRSVARKFDIIPTLTAIGSGVGIFGVATVVCDLILLYLLPKREFYNNMKFKVTEMMEKEVSLCLTVAQHPV